MRLVSSIILLLLAPLVQAQGNGSITLLNNLGSQLRQLRAMPLGTPTDARCPENKESLVGTTQHVLQKELGAPDFVNKQSSSWSYFFTSPVPRTQKGGGFPELRFYFSKSNLVASVTCYYSR
jgi:hypothetical protein